MNPLFRAAVDVQRFCDSQGWQFCFIGAGRHPLGRAPTDGCLVLTLLTGFSGEEQYIDALLRRFPARRADARQFALQYRVLLLESNTVPVDVALGAMAFEERAVARLTSTSPRLSRAGRQAP